MFSKLLVKTPTKPIFVVLRKITTSPNCKIRDDPYKMFMHYNNRKEHNVKNVEKACVVFTIFCIGSTALAVYHDWEELWEPWKHRPEYKPYQFLWSSYSKRFPWGEFPVMFNKYRNFTKEGYHTDDEGNLIKELVTYP